MLILSFIETKSVKESDFINKMDYFPKSTKYSAQKMLQIPLHNTVDSINYKFPKNKKQIDKFRIENFDRRRCNTHEQFNNSSPTI